MFTYLTKEHTLHELIQLRIVNCKYRFMVNLQASPIINANSSVQKIT